MSYKFTLSGRIFILRWGPPELSDVDALLQDCQRASKSAGGPLVTIMIIPADIPAPEGDVRDRMGTRAKDLLDCNESIHCVIEGDGFKSSIKRSVTTSVLLFSGKRGKIFVHKTLDEALAALRDRLRELDTAPERVFQAARVSGLLTPCSAARPARFSSMSSLLP